MCLFVSFVLVLVLRFVFCSVLLADVLLMLPLIHVCLYFKILDPLLLLPPWGHLVIRYYF